MNPERWRKISMLFRRALEREPGERPAFLAESCPDDEGTRVAVESLLASHEEAARGGFIESGALGRPSGQDTAEMRAAEVVPIDTQLGPYRILTKLGAGGMGAVYLARDTRLGRRVALKILPAHLARDEEYVRRFEQEARAASALNHPNILTVHEIGEAEGRRFIATEYVEGATLRDATAGGRVDLATALDVCAQVAGALAKAHAHGIVHRDVKPENIMVDEEGHAKVLDFGIAKKFAPGPARGTEAHEGGQVNTASGVVLGTSTYMSPEQVRGAELDGRADVWSLGVVLYELVAGRVPFDAPTYGDLIVAILQDDPPPLARAAPEVPTELETVLRRALAKKREERYQTARDLQNDLRRLRRRLDDAHDAGRPAQTADTAARLAPVGPPPPQHATVMTGQPRATTEQRKQVSVLFADLAGLPALAAGGDAEELSEVTKALLEVVERVVAEHGGTVEKHVGDTVVALWGARAAHEDDPERAVRAALQVQQAVSAFVPEGSPPTGPEPAAAPVRVGVSTGLVLVGGVVGAEEFTATGEAVRLAARLQQAAPPGGVLISHDTYRHVRGVFDVQAPESLAFEGHSQPVEVYRVLRAKPRAFRVRTRGVEGVETRMVGRQGELRHLMDALETASEDRELQIVTVFGDAGLGKSRLLYEFSNWQELLPEPWYVFNGRAGETTMGLPYALVRDVFSFRFEIRDSDPPEEARDKLERGLLAMSGAQTSPDAEAARMRAHFIGQLIGLDFSESKHLSGVLDDVRQLRDRAFRYAAEFFADASRRHPILLYLDDIHWADDGSLDFVDHLVRHCAGVPMFVLCLARPALLERRPAWGEGQERHTRLTLRPLTKKESRQLVEEILRQARDVPPALRELIVGGAEGNPFYVEELIKMLIDQRVIVAGAEVWSVDASRLGEVQVPPTLTGVLQARLDKLSPAEKTALQRASVVGRVFWDGAVGHLGEKLTGLIPRETMAEDGGARTEGEAGAVAAVLERLRRKELIYRREASSFAGAHEYTFKHALLRDVTYESVLRRERREYHRRAAEWLARQSGGRAGEYAGLVAEHYERAGETAESAEWYGRAGGQARETYAPEAAVNFYRKAIEFATRPPATSTAAAPRQAAATAGTGEALRARLVEWYEGLGETLRLQSCYAEAVDAFEQMRAAAEASGDATASARAWNGLALVEAARGDNRAMLESTRRAAELAGAAVADARSERVLARALNLQSQALTRLGEARQAMLLGDQALALATGLGDEGRHERADSLKSLGMAYHVLARFEQAEWCKEQALALYRELGDRTLVGNMLNSLGETARLRGDYERAFARYQEALAVAREIGNRPGEMFYLGNLGAARLGMGDHAGAEIDLRQSITLAEAAGYKGASENYRFLAEALLAQDKTGEALEAARRALGLGREFENYEHIGEAWRVLGLIAARTAGGLAVGETSYDAGACFAESLSAFARIRLDAESARTLRDWARYEWDQGEEAEGRRMWEKARDTFRRLGMTSEAERMSEESEGP